jgi:DNA-3-methyladenine glycosylase II
MNRGTDTPLSVRSPLGGERSRRTGFPNLNRIEFGRPPETWGVAVLARNDSTAVAAPTRTSLTPPRLSSLPLERQQLEYSSRSLVFAEDGPRILRAWGAPDHPWVLAVEVRGDRWAIEAWGADPPAARRAVRDLFSLDHDLAQFYRCTRREPILGGTERRFRGLRLPRDASVYESVLYAIIGQQLSVQSALAIQRRLFAQTASVVSAGGLEIPAVPPPAAVVRLGLEGLRATGLSGAKSQAILALAGTALTGPVGGERLGATPLDRAIEQLMEMRGVGRWTAENALLRGTGRTDIFVAGDLGIRVALDENGILPRSAPEDVARAWGDRWYSGWGSYATLYLWRKLVADRRVLAG